MRRLLLLLSLTLLPATACAPASDLAPADLVLTNGRVVTVDEAMPEGEALAVRDGRIVAVGSSDDIATYIGDGTEVVDLAGRLTVPGFIEGHGHFTSLGRAKLILDLTAVSSWDEIVAMVAEAAAAAEPGAWIFGRGWHQEKWDATPEPNVDGVPLHEGLSAVSPANPVHLGHASGHASFANGLALEFAGIDGATPDPAGGTIVRDAGGSPTGLLRETAQDLVGRVAAAADSARPQAERDAEFRRMVELAGAEALSKGVTTFHDAGTGFGTIDRFRALADAGELPIRLHVMVRGESNEQLDSLLGNYFMDGYADGFLTVRSLKRQIDGALGSHGAWLLDPYIDHESTGLTLEPVEDIEGTARVAVRHGFQVNTHAIGDRANREVLDLYERVWAETDANGPALRWRIEHAQHLHPDDIQRFVDLGVIAAMQGIHATSDGPWVFARLGPERAESGAYLWRTLWDAGVVITNGTDVPVEDIDPIASYHATVTRVMSDGEAFFPGEALTRMEALETYTINNAYAGFQEAEVGSLTPGKRADIVVLSRDILTVPDEEILDARVDMTILGGEIRYRAAEGR